MQQEDFRQDVILIETALNIIENRYRRLATAGVFASLFAYAAVMTVTPTSINQVRSYYNASGFLAGLLPALLMLGFFVAVIAGGRYSDRKGKLPVMTLGCALMAVGTAIFAWAHSFPVALAATLIMGAGGGFSEGISVAVLSDLYGGPRRTAMMNGSQFVFAAGAVAVPLGIARMLQAGVDWQVGYIITAALCVVATLVGLAAVSTHQEKPIAANGETTNWRELLSNRTVIFLSIGIMLYVGSELGQANWLANYFKLDLKSSIPLAAATVALFWAGMGAGRVVAAWLAKYVSNVQLIRGALVLAAVSQGVLLLIRQPIPAAIMVPVLGFCLAPIWPTIVSCAGEAYPQQTGTVLGIVVAAGSIGGGLVPWVVGAAADHIGLSRALWLCMILLVTNFGLFTVLQGRGSR